jgi:2-C-methyl-D-erythritol 4-phosphate cytidylyltransferase
VAAIPVLAVADTIKRVTAEGRVIETLDREQLRAVQTPQGFDRAVLQAAHASAAGSEPVTDDAALLESLGVQVVTVEGSPLAFKITTRHDLDIAEALTGSGAPVTAPEAW